MGRLRPGYTCKTHPRFSKLKSPLMQAVFLMKCKHDNPGVEVEIGGSFDLEEGETCHSECAPSKPELVKQICIHYCQQYNKAKAGKAGDETEAFVATSVGREGYPSSSEFFA